MLCIAVGGRLAWPEMSVVMTFQAIRQIPCVTILRDVASPGSNEIEDFTLKGGNGGNGVAGRYVTE